MKYSEEFHLLNVVYHRMEVSVIRRALYFRGFSNCLCDVSSKCMVFFIFLVYGLLGNHLTPEKVYLLTDAYDFNIIIGLE